jgi:hypothetical protein
MIGELGCMELPSGISYLFILFVNQCNLETELCFSTVFVCFQLLGELLLDRHNFAIMTRYVSQPENLKTMMNMLRESSRNIQFEAFHVFKVQYCNLVLISFHTFNKLKRR